jgi:small subunit ribosomal protein S6
LAKQEGNKRYETIIIANPTASDEDLNTTVAHLEQVIADGGGTLIRTDRWGKRRLAYPVRKCEDGNYTLFFHESPAAVVRELERRIRIDDKLIKFITVRVDWEEKVARAEAERAARPPRPRRPGMDSDEDFGDLGDGFTSPDMIG